jgi:hypothetical protein
VGFWSGRGVACDPGFGGRMFVEFSDGRISAAYVEEQYPGQKWLPAADEGLRDFLADLPRLGKDAKGQTCLLPCPVLQPIPEKRTPKTEPAMTELVSRVHGRKSSMDQITHSLAMRFITAIYEDSQHEPLPLRWIGDSAERAGIQHSSQLQLALANAAASGLLKVDGSRSVTLTLSGIRAARQMLASAGNARLGELVVQVHPTMSAGPH